jgi:hypothetical protein
MSWVPQTFAKAASKTKRRHRIPLSVMPQGHSASRISWGGCSSLAAAIAGVVLGGTPCVIRGGWGLSRVGGAQVRQNQQAPRDFVAERLRWYGRGHVGSPR